MVKKNKYPHFVSIKIIFIFVIQKKSCYVDIYRFDHYTDTYALYH